MNNSLFTIAPYKWNGQWVFDDPRVGLVREPFVGGADTIIDLATADIPNAASGFVAVFSARPFPGANMALQWVREEGDGNVYRWDRRPQAECVEGWLCPALLKYFETAPRWLFVQFKPAA